MSLMPSSSLVVGNRFWYEKLYNRVTCGITLFNCLNNYFEFTNVLLLFNAILISNECDFESMEELSMEFELWIRSVSLIGREKGTPVLGHFLLKATHKSSFQLIQCKTHECSPLSATEWKSYTESKFEHIYLAIYISLFLWRVHIMIVIWRCRRSSILKVKLIFSLLTALTFCNCLWLSILDLFSMNYFDFDSNDFVVRPLLLLRFGNDCISLSSRASYWKIELEIHVNERGSINNDLLSNELCMIPVDGSICLANAMISIDRSA